MSLLHSLSHSSALCTLHHRRHHRRSILHLNKHLRRPPSTLSCRSYPRTLPSSEQEFLEAIADSDERLLPCVRTYENDSARLSLVGAVDSRQALTAAAADGGEAASEHVQSGARAMVVETVYPGGAEGRSTVSTRLFLPARKVKEKASQLKITNDMLGSSTSRNILAMTFRQVVVQQLWNFQLVLFHPGADRNMADLESPREVPWSFALSSLDEGVISMLAEVVCTYALSSTEQLVLGNAHEEFFRTVSRWFRKPGRFSSKDSSVILWKLFEYDMVENATILLEQFSASKGKNRLHKSGSKLFGWKQAVQSKLEKIGGPDFCSWLSEYVPAYRLQVDTQKLKDLKLDGWRQLDGSMQEVLLTQSQMAALTNILDLFYEDVYTLPTKELSCHMVLNPTILSNEKSPSLLKMLSLALAGVIIAVALKAFGQGFLPQFTKEKRYLNGHGTPPSEIDSLQDERSDQAKV
ncbi:uncharacterized protein LOC115739811 isoform X2 [Rhodamnia argentea]|uniref:Uncharacterized protein LOC115739811 isoform X2 n=1 Tax=Rhodamnia argentea TaxID=178133 RepID=A0A8B8P306_9MYRT|nr:uncharacterized protein LOC115739811 isoform X2 [Rhodamnia argentea]